MITGISNNPPVIAYAPQYKNNYSFTIGIKSILIETNVVPYPITIEMIVEDACLYS